MKGHRKLGRPTAHRKAMLRNLTTAFGSFSYAMEMSHYAKGDYRVHDLEQSIQATERQ